LLSLPVKGEKQDRQDRDRFSIRRNVSWSVCSHAGAHLIFS